MQIATWGLPLGRGLSNRPPDQQTDILRQHWPACIVAGTALLFMVVIIPVLINRRVQGELGGKELGSNYRHSRSVGALLTQYGQERDKEIRKEKEKKLCYLEEAHAAEDEFREAMDGAEDLDAGAEKEQLQATATRAAELAEAHFRKALKGDPKNLFCAEVSAAGKCPGDRAVCGDLCNCIIMPSAPTVAILVVLRALIIRVVLTVMSIPGSLLLPKKLLNDLIIQVGVSKRR